MAEPGDDHPNNVILEDLDRIEAERESTAEKPTLRALLFPGNRRDAQLWRRLFAFARPYLFKIIFCLLLSTVVALATAGKLAMLRYGLEPIVNPQSIQADPIETVKEKVREALPFLFDEAEEKKEDPQATPDQDEPFDPTNAKNQLILVVIVLILIVLFEQTGRYIQNVLIRATGHKIVMDIRNALFAQVMSFSMKFHNKNHSGKLISRLTNDLGVFGSFFTHTAVAFTVDIFMLIGIAVYLAWQDSLYILAVIGVVCLAFLPIQAIGRGIRRRDKQTQRSTSLIYSVLAESLTGQKIVKAFVAEDYEYEKFRQATAQTYRNTMKVARLRSRTQPVVEVSGTVVTAVLVLFLGSQVIYGKIEFGEMTAIVAGLVMAIGPVRRLAKANNNIQSALASADRVSSLLYSDPEIQDHEHAVILKGFDRAIEYDHVHFEHDHGIPVLKDICLTIAKGEVVALVGPSGSGKSTMADLVPRFYDVNKGAITIDGQNLRNLDIRSLRQQIGIVSQETILFNDTVGMNISYGMPDVDRSRVVAAAKAANAHDFIMETEDGYDTFIGERGVRLSGGQKQRLAIARAILKNPPILILDEATSSLDSEAEHQVQEALGRLMEGRTTLVIAHRLSTIRGADRIAVIKDGKIVELGRHDDLMEKDGIYAKLHDLQSGDLSE